MQKSCMALHDSAKKGELVMHSVVIIDDHPLMAYATKELLEQELDVKVAALARNGEQGLEIIAASQPDLLLTDYKLPDMTGKDVAERISKCWPSIKVVIFSSIDVSSVVPQLLMAKVDGILSKENSQHTIVHAVSSVLDGFAVIPRTVDWQMGLCGQEEAVDLELSDKEVALMRYILDGNTIEQIAGQIHMSKRSVDNWIRKMYEKMGVKGRTQALELFLKSKYYAR
ncbi:DNA-binding response regulator [Paenibacillus sp. YN15]|nr:DNA-binding response regulator [Paenibacillus sp. YN15]